MNDFDQFFSMNILLNILTAYSLLYVLGAFRKNLQQFRNLFLNCGIEPILNSISYFEIWTLASILNLGFLCSGFYLVYRIDKIVGVLDIAWFQGNRANFTVVHSCDQLKQFLMCSEILSGNGIESFSRIVLHVQQT